MSGNTFGKLFTVTTFGESHGPALGCIVDGCPPGLALSEADLQPDIDRRRTGTSRHEPAARTRSGQDSFGCVRRADDGHPDRHSDRKKIDARATTTRSRTDFGPATRTTRINRNMASATTAVADARRRARRSCESPPARSRASTCASGSVCDLRLSCGDRSDQIGAGRSRSRRRQSVLLPGSVAHRRARQRADRICAAPATRSARGSTVVATACRQGLGEPVFDRLDADIAHALMSINAVKAVEIGAGFAVVARTAASIATSSPRRVSRATMPAAFSAASAPGRTSWCASRSSRRRASRSRANDRHGRQRGRDRHDGPARSVRRPARDADRRGDARDRADGSLPAPPRAEC